ncbi:MAG: hypothetical protein ACYDCI_06115 [Candidatus Limnocylindrales bacterium]
MAGRPRPAVVIAVLVIVGLILTVLVALSGVGSSTSGPAVPTGTAGSLPPAVTGVPSFASSPAPSASAAPSSPPSGAGSGGPFVAIDRELLQALPVSVAGIPLVEDTQTESHDAADPTHAVDLAALAVALAVNTHSNDLAIATVVRPKPGIFSDAYYRSWRDTFDAGACSQAGGLAGGVVGSVGGGVAGTSETTIGGHDTFIARCAGGILTYHVHLGGGVGGDDRIVSITTIGAADFGRLIVEGLR